MNSTASNLHKLFHSGLIKSSLKRFTWVGCAYFVILALLLPVRVMMTLTNVNEPGFHLNTFTRLYTFGGEPFQLVLMMGIPALVGIMVFHYLNHGAAADFLHSLPVRRTTFFCTQLIVGLLLLMVPVLLTGLLSILLIPFTQLTAWLSVGDVLTWAGTTMVMNLVIYLFTVMVGMFTGVTAVQGAFIYILLFLPVGLWMLLSYNLEALVFGFSSHHLSMNGSMNMETFSPLTRIAHLPYDALRTGEAAGYLAASLVFGLVAWKLYQVRRMERNRQTIVFRGLRYFFLFGITLCVMLVGGMYIYMLNSSTAKIIAAYMVFSLLGYTIAQAVLQKSLRIFSLTHYKAYIGCLVLIFLLVGGVTTDILGYEKRVPDAADVKGAYVGHYPYVWLNDNLEEGLYRTPENIERVLALHQAVLEQEASQGSQMRQYRNLPITYQLEGGGRMFREYRVDEARYAVYLEALKESEEHKRMEFQLLSLTGEEVVQIILRSAEIEKRAFINDREEIQELLELMQQEILEADYKALYGYERSLGTVHVRVEPRTMDRMDHRITSVYGDEVTVARRQSFGMMEAWLKEKGYYEQATITAADIHQVAVHKVADRETFEIVERNWLVRQPDSQITENPDHITECLALYSPSWRYPNEFPVYMVGFHDEMGRQLFMGRFEADALPDFVTQE
jgi:ABC-2 type transport system permease protein